MAAQAVETIVGYAASNPARVGGPLPTHASSYNIIKIVCKAGSPGGRG